MSEFNTFFEAALKSPVQRTRTEAAAHDAVLKADPLFDRRVEVSATLAAAKFCIEDVPLKASLAAIDDELAEIQLMDESELKALSESLEPLREAIDFHYIPEAVEEVKSQLREDELLRD
jgi:hypothetical protein